MRLEQLYYFFVIAQTGSMRIASEKCFITQPALSEAIKSLEIELGMTLFGRSRSGMTLTAQGQEALPLVEKILNAAAALQHLHTRPPSLEQPANTLSIQSVDGLVRQKIYAIIDFFSSIYPDVSLDIKTLYSVYPIIQGVLGNDCDIGLFSAPAAWIAQLQYDRDQFLLESICIKPLYFIVNSNSPLARAKTLSIADIGEYSWSIVGTMPEIQQFMDLQFGAYNLPIDFLTTDFPLSVKRIASNSKNIGAFYPIEPFASSSKYRTYPIKMIPCQENIAYVYAAFYHKTLQDNQIAKLFLKSIQQQ